MLSASVTGQEMTFKTACPDKILPDSKGWNGRQRLCSQLRETAEEKVLAANSLLWMPPRLQGKNELLDM